MILANTKAGSYVTLVDVHALPASHISYANGQKIKSFIKSMPTPNISLSFGGIVIGATVISPVASYFSSKGPEQANSNILKPDIIGPGVNILASWSFEVGFPGVKYNLIYGTSMSTPHLSGIVALVKSEHPDW